MKSTTGWSWVGRRETLEAFHSLKFRKASYRLERESTRLLHLLRRYMWIR